MQIKQNASQSLYATVLTNTHFPLEDQTLLAASIVEMLEYFDSGLTQGRITPFVSTEFGFQPSITSDLLLG